jgi:uncharacterized protein (DUF2147 family)
MKKVFSVFVLVLILVFKLSAQDITKGTWYNDEKNARLQFYETNGKLFGKIVWLKDPNKNGKPRTDEFNPNDKLKTVPLLGLVFLKNFEKDGEKAWQDGTIYDPKSGKTYSSNMKFVSPTQLDVRGYIGISLIGKTSKFTKAD